METIDIKKLEERLKEAEKKIVHFDKIIWAAAAVLVIFGASGAFGIKLLYSARDKIDILNNDISRLENKLTNWNSLVTTAENKINETADSATKSLKKVQSEIELSVSGSIKLLNSETNSFLEKYRVDVKKISESEAEKFSLDNIKVSSISIINKKGKEGINLSAIATGGLIRINDGNGVGKLHLFSSFGGSGYLSISDENDNVTHRLGSDKGGMPFFHLVKNDGNHYMSLVSLESNDYGGCVSLYNKKGKESITLSALDTGGMIQIKDSNGAAKLKLFSSKGGGVGYLKIFDENDNVTHELGSFTKGDGPFFHLMNNDGNPYMKLQSDDNGGRVSLYNKENVLTLFMASQKDGDGYIKVKSVNNKSDKVITP